MFQSFFSSILQFRGADCTAGHIVHLFSVHAHKQIKQSTQGNGGEATAIRVLGPGTNWQSHKRT